MKAAAGALGFFLALLAAFAGPPGASGFGSLNLTTVHPRQAEGREVLEKCRRAGLPGDVYYEFELQVMPRRGAERILPGRLWAGRTGSGLVWRIDLNPGAAGEVRWLVEGGSHPSVWRWDGKAVGRAGSFDPLAPGVDVTPFDIQFPPSFLYWPDETLVGMTRVLGRPAYEFEIRPPAAFSARHPDIAGVRSTLDAEYDVPLRTELLGRGGDAQKTMSLVDLKKVDGQWIVKEVDVRNEATRNKTRLDVTGAAVGVDFSPLLFTPGRLAQSVGSPAVGRIERFGP